jgi:hypothetical protein
MTKATLDLIESARESTRLAREHLTDIDRQRTEALQRRAVIFDAPLTKEDFLATLVESAQRKAAAFARSLAQQFSSPRGLMTYREALTVGSDAFLRTLVVAGYGQNPPVSEGALCLYAQEGIRHGLQGVADAMRWPADAIPMAERAKLLKQADATIADLTKQGAALAEALGLGAYPFPQSEPTPPAASYFTEAMQAQGLEERRARAEKAAGEAWIQTEPAQR